MAAFSSELHAKHHTVDPPKIKFFATKIVAEEFFLDNPSDNMLDHHSKPPFVAKLRYKWPLKFRIARFSVLEGVAEWCCHA